MKSSVLDFCIKLPHPSFSANDQEIQEELFYSRQYFINFLLELKDELNQSEKVLLYQFIGEMLSDYPTFIQLNREKLVFISMELLDIVIELNRKDLSFLVTSYWRRLESLKNEEIDRIIERLNSSTFSYLQEYIFAGDHERCLESILKDESRRELIFNRLYKYNDTLSFFTNNFVALMKLDSHETVKFLSLYFFKDLRSFLDKLVGFDELEFNFMQNILEIVPEKGDFIFSNEDLYARYIALTCQYMPSMVVSLIEQAEILPIQAALKSCLQYGITDALVILYEKMGDYELAFQRLLDSANANKISKFCNQRPEFWNKLLQSKVDFSLYLDKVPFSILAASSDVIGNQEMLKLTGRFLYEKQAHAITERIMKKENFSLLDDLTGISNGNLKTKGICDVCRIQNDFKDVVLFSCNHSCHVECIEDAAICGICSGTTCISSNSTSNTTLAIQRLLNFTAS